MTSQQLGTYLENYIESTHRWPSPALSLSLFLLSGSLCFLGVSALPDELKRNFKLMRELDDATEDLKEDINT